MDTSTPKVIHGHVDTSANNSASATWSTAPIHEKMEVSKPSSSVSSLKNSPLAPNYANMKHSKTLSRKAKARKAVAVERALAFKDQLEAKIAKSN